MEGPHPTNRQLAAQETRRKLLRAADGLIRRKGLANTSIAEITRACGVSAGTFYTYFKRKEDVVFALSWEAFGDIAERALRADGPFPARLSRFMAEFSGYIEHDGVRLCQEWVRNVVDPDLDGSGEGVAKLRLDVDSLRRLFADGVVRRELTPDCPVDALAHTLTDMLYGQMLCWAMSGAAYGLRGRTEEFCRTVLPSLLAPYLVD